MNIILVKYSQVEGAAAAEAIAHEWLKDGYIVELREANPHDENDYDWAAIGYKRCSPA